MSIIELPEKDPDSVEPYFIVWCSKDGTNDGSASDRGKLQGATISTVTWTVPSGITKNSDNKSAVTIKGVSYSANTVCTIWLSGGALQVDYTLTCEITTSDGRTLDQSILIPVRQQ
jgi:hypothetical protein